jgi:hypothetical protein
LPLDQSLYFGGIETKEMHFQILLFALLVGLASGEDCPHCWQGCFPLTMTAGEDSILI